MRGCDQGVSQSSQSVAGKKVQQPLQRAGRTTSVAPGFETPRHETVKVAGLVRSS